MTGSELTYVFERPSLFDQVGQRVLHYTGRPLVHFTLVIICSTNNSFDTLRHTEEVMYTVITSQSGFIIKQFINDSRDEKIPL